MIPQAAIIQWRNTVPWRNMHQVEQDLILSRALVAIYSDEFLAHTLAFRGGTALHKLYLSPQARYSEDLDFVQIGPSPIGPTLNRLREVLGFLGEPKTKRKMSNNVILLGFETTFPPVINLRVKIEINCTEHFTVLGHNIIPFDIDNLWFSGSCEILTFHIEELLGTKLRALYQRKKGRDLFDLAYSNSLIGLETAKVIECYKRYIIFPDNHMPTAGEYKNNLEKKIADPAFRDDVLPMLRTEIEYDVNSAFSSVFDTYVTMM